MCFTAKRKLLEEVEEVVEEVKWEEEEDEKEGLPRQYVNSEERKRKILLRHGRLLAIAHHALHFFFLNK